MSLPLLELDPASLGARNSTTFVDNMRLPVHRWYRYSAGFSAQWAESVIAETEAKAVFDPYAGSGTTLIAAESLGVEAVGVDIHPFVSRIARAKLHWRADPEVLLDRMRTVVAAVKQGGEVELPGSSLIDRCFPDKAKLADLVRLRDVVSSEKSRDEYSELLWLAMVSIIRLCSPAGTAQWQYVLPNRTKARAAEPVEAFIARVELFAEDMRAMSPRRSAPSARLITADARTLGGVQDDSADLILTSPPYANNYDYADATRLEQTFLGEVEGWGDLKPLRKSLLKSATQHMGGWDPSEALDSPLLDPIRGELLPVYDELNEIRKSKAGNKAYHLMILGYFYDSAQVWNALRRVARPGARVCFVVGDSAPYGVHAPVERWLGELAVASGFERWSFDKVRDRNVKWKNRKHDHPLHEGRLWVEG